MSHRFGVVLGKTKANGPELFLLLNELIIIWKGNSIAIKNYWFRLNFRFIFGKEYCMAGIDESLPECNSY